MFGHEPDLKMVMHNLGFSTVNRETHKLPIFVSFYDDIAT